MQIHDLGDMKRWVDENFRQRDRVLDNNFKLIDRRFQEIVMSNQPDPMELQDRMLKRGMDYNQAIIGLGYGAFIALWVATAGKLPLLVFGITGFLLLFSLLVFIASYLWDTWRLIRAAPQFRVAGLTERNDMLNRHDDETIRNGPRVFLLSTIPGVIGGAILIGGFISITLRAAGAV